MHGCSIPCLGLLLLWVNNFFQSCWNNICPLTPNCNTIIVTEKDHKETPLNFAPVKACRPKVSPFHYRCSGYFIKNNKPLIQNMLTVDSLKMLGQIRKAWKMKKLFGVNFRGLIRFWYSHREVSSGWDSERRKLFSHLNYLKRKRREESLSRERSSWVLLFER